MDCGRDERRVATVCPYNGVLTVIRTYDDPPLHHGVHVLEQPDLDPRLGLKETEDQVL